MKISVKVLRNFIVFLIVGIIIICFTITEEDSMLTIVCRIFTGIILIYCLIKGGQEDKLINPYWLFSITPFSLLLYTEKVSSIYLQQLTPKTWLLALINMVAFLTALRLSFAKEKYKDNVAYKSSKHIERFLIQDAVILFCLSKIPVLYRMLFGNSMPFASILSLFIYVAIVCVMKSKNKLWICLISGMNLIFMLSSAINKTAVLFLAMAYLVSYEKYYIKNTKSKCKMIIGIGILSIVFIVIIFPLKDYIHGGGKIQDFGISNILASSDYYTNSIEWHGNQLLMMPYMYLVTAWNNLQYVLETQDIRTFGLWILKPILGYLQIDSLFEKYYVLVPYSSFNTFTYITVLFKDFGYWGSAIGSIILGVFVKYVYKVKYCNTASAFNAACYSMTACATLEMFFSNHFFSQSYPFTVILIIMLYKFLCRTIFKRTSNTLKEE